MKVIKKKVKTCEETDWSKIKVLDLEYSHRGERGQILIRDYEDSMYDYILKQLRVKVRNHYNNNQVLKKHNKERAK